MTSASPSASRLTCSLLGAASRGHPSLQIFFELILRYNISVDQFLLERPAGKNTQRRQLDALLDDMDDNGIRVVTATAKEIVQIEQAQSNGKEDA